MRPVELRTKVATRSEVAPSTTAELAVRTLPPSGAVAGKSQDHHAPFQENRSRRPTTPVDDTVWPNRSMRRLPGTFDGPSQWTAEEVMKKRSVTSGGEPQLPQLPENAASSAAFSRSSKLFAVPARAVTKTLIRPAAPSTRNHVQRGQRDGSAS